MFKSFFRRALFSLGIVAAVTAPAAAQLPSVLTFRAPFSFVVGDRVVPPGTYSVRRVGDDQSLYLIQGPKSAFLETNLVGRPPAIGARQCEVIFLRYGDQYVLNEVWDPSSETGVLSTMKFNDDREALERARPVAEAIPASVLVSR
jgi:hypothetical protein